MNGPIGAGFKMTKTAGGAKREGGKGILSVLLLCLAAGLGLRLVLLFTCLSGLDADQAVPGLMGMHILKGHFPNLMWEYKYCGAFITYLAALNFKLFGVSVLSLKLATFPLAAASIVLTYGLAADIHGRRAGLAAALLTALPPVFVLIFSVSARGVYAETLALGPAVLYLSVRLSRLERGRSAAAVMLGFVSGFAFWISPLILPYVAAASWGLLCDGRSPSKKEWGIMSAFFLAGCSPLLVYNAMHPLVTFLSLGSRPMNVSSDSFRADLAGLGAAGAMAKYSLLYMRGLPHALAAVFGNACSVFWLANPAAASRPARAVVCLLYAVPVIYCAVRQGREIFRDPFFRLFAAGLVFAGLGFLDSPRYLIPVWVGISGLFAAAAGGTSLPAAARAALLSAVLLLNLGGALACLDIKAPPYGDLVNYLSSQGLYRGYAGYWTAYPVTFLSREKIIVSPTLDLRSVHPRSRDTYPFYANTVDAAGKVFYVLNGSAEGMDVFEKKMADRKILYRKGVVPPFAVYHSFSRRFYPADLDLPPRFLSAFEPFFY